MRALPLGRPHCAAAAPAAKAAAVGGDGRGRARALSWFRSLLHTAWHTAHRRRRSVPVRPTSTAPTDETAPGAGLGRPIGEGTGRETSVRRTLLLFRRLRRVTSTVII